MNAAAARDTLLSPNIPSESYVHAVISPVGGQATPRLGWCRLCTRSSTGSTRTAGEPRRAATASLQLPTTSTLCKGLTLAGRVTSFPPHLAIAAAQSIPPGRLPTESCAGTGISPSAQQRRWLGRAWHSKHTLKPANGAAWCESRVNCFVECTSHCVSESS